MILNPPQMDEHQSSSFNERHQRSCKTSRNMIYNYYDFKPDHHQSELVALLLHGHGDLAIGWRNTIPSLLASGVRCIAPDLLGFGGSSKPVDSQAYRLRLMADDLLDVLLDAPVLNDARIVVIGHDWGSQLATRLLLHHPDRFMACGILAGPYIPPFPAKITLDQFISQNPNFAYWDFFTSAECPELVRQRLSVFWNAVVRTGEEKVVPMAEIEGRLRAEQVPSTWEQRPKLWDQETCDLYSVAYLRGGWEAPMNWYKAFLENYGDELAFVGTKIASPLLIVLGERDPAVPPQAVKGADMFLENFKVIVLPAGHWITQESGPAVARAVVQWLNEIDPATREKN